MEAGQTGGGGGGGGIIPEISAVDRAIAAKICTMVVCDVIYKTVYLDLKKKKKKKKKKSFLLFYIN